MDKEVTKSDNEIMIEIQKEIESALNKYGVIGACDINYGYALYVDWGNGRTNTERDRKSTRLNSSHTDISRMPSSA